VIDNYGDIGVCWRLARQLAQPPWSRRVRLWVDDLARCHALVPGVQPEQAQQCHDGVEVRHWTHAPTATTPAEVVIEAFGCNPPADFVRAMTADTIWINLEYLSAEAWIEDCHGLPSPQPGGLNKWFFFPGFTPRTGGLLRATNWRTQCTTWQADPRKRETLLQSLRVPDTTLTTLRQGARQVLLFCYPHAPVAALLQGLRADATPSVVLACPGSVNAACKALVRDSHVFICELPFVAQTMFDALLHTSDLNCVRGEDSVVQALWAGRPLLWHIYPQAENTHLDKLNAWLERAPYPAQVAQLTRHWNAATSQTTSEPSMDADAMHTTAHWLSETLVPTVWTQWHHAAQHWCHTLAQRDDLASTLVAFCTNKRQNR